MGNKNQLQKIGVTNKTIPVKTKKRLEFINITEKVKSFVNNSGIKNGLVKVHCFHTSSAVLVNEDEPLLIQDIKNQLERIAPSTMAYNHDDFARRTVNMCDDECRNGHSHCKAIHLPTSVTLNLIEGELQIGKWQEIFFLELDRARDRKVQIQVLGGE